MGRKVEFIAENFSGWALLLCVCLGLWVMGGSPSCRGKSTTGQGGHYDPADPNYSSIDQWNSQPQVDPGTIRWENTRRGQAQDRNRRRHNDSIWGR